MEGYTLEEIVHKYQPLIAKIRRTCCKGNPELNSLLNQAVIAAYNSAQVESWYAQHLWMQYRPRVYRYWQYYNRDAERYVPLNEHITEDNVYVDTEEYYITRIDHSTFLSKIKNPLHRNIYIMACEGWKPQEIACKYGLPKKYVIRVAEICREREQKWLSSTV